VDYGFLSEITENLKSLTIMDCNPKVNIQILEQLELQELTLEVAAECKWPSAFPKSLTELKVRLAANCPSLTELPRLRSLRTWGPCTWERIPSFESKDLAGLDLDAPNLKELCLKGIPSIKAITISGPKNLQLLKLHDTTKLEELNLLDMRGSVNLAPLEGLDSLRRFSLDGSRVSTPTLRPITYCKSLDWVFLGRTSVGDGNLSCLGSLPSLQKIGFNDRKANDISFEEFLKKNKVSRIGIKIK